MKQSGLSKKHYSANIDETVFEASASLRYHFLEKQFKDTSAREWQHLKDSGCVLPILWGVIIAFKLTTSGGDKVPFH